MPLAIFPKLLCDAFLLPDILFFLSHTNSYHMSVYSIVEIFKTLYSHYLCVFLFCRFDTPVHHMVASKARFGENASRRLLRDVVSRDRPVCQPCHVIITSRHSLPIFRRKPSQICVCHFWRLWFWIKNKADLSFFLSMFCVLQKGKADWLASRQRWKFWQKVWKIRRDRDIVGLSGYTVIALTQKSCVMK